MTESKRPRIPRGLKQDGAAIWSYGFRPFFLGGAIWALLTMALWIAALAQGLSLGGDLGAPLWHAHEMVFGFAPAVLAGFLLTAIPNWTGSLPVSGGPLIGLVMLWVVGRVAMTCAGITGPWLAAGLDLLFLPVLLAICGREILTGRKWNDLKVLAGVTAIMLGNFGFHISVLAGGDPQLWLRAAVAGYVLLVLIIGGRIIPSFTRNWLNQHGATRFPVAYNRFDMGVIAVSALALAFWALRPELRLIAVPALLAAGLNTARLIRWRGVLVRAEWLLLVLHLSYGFVPLGFLAIALAAFGVIAPVSSLHVLTVGVIATMMLAVMTRATRGHTGRPLAASRWTVASYLCLFAAALSRPLADLVQAPVLIEASGLFWMLGFGLFVVEYGPMLLRARRKPMA
ncbi:NnrS family protein [Paracoccus sp. DMF-8]|uniref:NnrS family protein n=1 Tax=Paracoccus sp. DMF-8 TaxID=3019445 RepID=UPI0023E3FAE9|nr:NnrS family protein [Paracoccus sp. DMF-8]MDF3608168.1 NnrS family protein [Paracoccus sp. DMF-8]